MSHTYSDCRENFNRLLSPREFWGKKRADIIAEHGSEGWNWCAVTARVASSLRELGKKEEQEARKRMRVQVTEKRIEQAMTWTAVVGGALTAGIVIYRMMQR